MRSETRRLTIYVGMSLLFLAAMFVLIYLLTNVFDLVPVQFTQITNAVLIAIVVYAIIRIMARFLERFLSKYMDKNKYHMVSFLFSVFGYFVLVLAVMAALGIDVSSIILGSTFVGLVLGLASQTVLSNLFGGMLLILTRPFKVGDHISLLAWQWGMALPSYPPKYFSKDEVRPSYDGYVDRVSINYTYLRGNDGRRIILPNGVLIQGSIVVNQKVVYVKARYEIPKTIKFSDIRENLINVISSAEGVIEDVKAWIDETTLNTYIMAASAKCDNFDPDEMRGRILEKIIEYIEPLKNKS